MLREPTCQVQSDDNVSSRRPWWEGRRLSKQDRPKTRLASPCLLFVKFIFLTRDTCMLLC